MTLAIALLLGAALAGCAGMPGGRLTADSPTEVKEKQAKERTEAFWKAIIAGDQATAYGFLSPGSRASVTLTGFTVRMAGSGFAYRDVKVDSAVCEAATCRVKMQLTYDFRQWKGVQTQAEETWIVEDGQLWLVRKD